MIQYAKINDKEYPFFFGMREVLDFSTKNNVEFDDVQGAVSISMDLFYELYEAASAKGARRADSDLVLTALEIEDAIDDDPDLLGELQSLFEKSKTVKSLKEKGEGKPKPSKKK